MNWHLSLDGLLTGSVAALVSFPGAIVAALVVIRHERIQRASLTAAAAQSAETAKFENAASQVSAAAHAVLIELIRPQVMVGSARVRLLEAKANFIAVAWSQHRPVAEWVSMTVQEALSLAGQSTRLWLFPGTAKRRQAAAQPLGQLMAALPNWTEGNIPDQWFADQLALTSTQNDQT